MPDPEVEPGIRVRQRLDGERRHPDQHRDQAGERDHGHEAIEQPILAARRLRRAGGRVLCGRRILSRPGAHRPSGATRYTHRPSVRTGSPAQLLLERGRRRRPLQHHPDLRAGPAHESAPAWLRAPELVEVADVRHGVGVKHPVDDRLHPGHPPLHPGAGAVLDEHGGAPWQRRQAGHERVRDVRRARRRVRHHDSKAGEARDEARHDHRLLRGKPAADAKRLGHGAAERLGQQRGDHHGGGRDHAGHQDRPPTGQTQHEHRHPGDPARPQPDNDRQVRSSPR